MAPKKQTAAIKPSPENLSTMPKVGVSVADAQRRATGRCHRVLALRFVFTSKMDRQ
jgi:hypothetical protein